MKNKHKNAFITLLAALALAACASSPPPGGSVRAGKVPKYTPPTQPQYGEWYIEPTTCTVRARAADFTLSTDGRVENGVIYLRALFAAPLASPPTPEVSEILAPIPVEGARRGYNIVLAYDSATAAHMLKRDTFLIIAYQPLTHSQVLESSFQTYGLMFALADLAKFCK